MSISNLRAATAANSNRASSSWYEPWTLSNNPTDKAEDFTNLPKKPKTKEDIRAEDISDLMRYIGSDYYEGRKPGTEKSLEFAKWLANAMKKRGLKPGGSNGTYFENMAAVGTEASRTKPSTFTFKSGDKEMNPVLGEDFVFWGAPNGETNVKLDNSDIVFVGYGITTKPGEKYSWDDYKNVDVKGKTVIILSGEPPSDDPNFFDGKAATSYNRTIYKFDEAARHGAKAAFMIYAKGADWERLMGSYGSLRVFRDTPAIMNKPNAPVQGWLKFETAQKILQNAGLDFDKLKAEAGKKEGFKAITLKDQKLSADANIDIKKFETPNVVGILEGTDSKLKNDYILYTGHWDHLGRDRYAKTGDTTFNGTVDNGSGTAMNLEIMEKFNKNRPKRSLMFVGFTAEESGLLGSEDFAEKLNDGKLPVKSWQVVGGVNIDEDIPHTKAKNLSVIGYGVPDNTSGLMPLLEKYLTAQGRVIAPDPAPEQNFYQRSDHYNLVRLSGIPMLMPFGATDLVAGGKETGGKILEDYEASYYHKKPDEWMADWLPSGKLDGLTEDAQLFYNWGQDLANTTYWPEWDPTSPYKKIRENDLAKRPIS